MTIIIKRCPHFIKPYIHNLINHHHHYSTLSPKTPSHNVQNKTPFNQPNSKNTIAPFNSQISKLGKTGNVKQAEKLFHQMPQKNIITWTAMITVYAENGYVGKARRVFDEMPERNVASWNAMITAYVKNGLRVREGWELFERMPERNAVSFAAMITGFAKAGWFEEGVRLYKGMVREWRDPVCGNALINGYLKAGELERAVRVFERMVRRDVVSWSSMVDGYCKRGFVKEGREVFDLMPEKNVVSWTSMISGYMKGCGGGGFEEGFRLFLRMRREGVVSVNPTTFTIVLEGCGNCDRYREGSQIHGLVARMGFENDVILCNSVISLYGKFRCVDAAHRMFQTMSKKDIFSWNALIAAYVQDDRIEEAYDLFQSMPKQDVVSWTTMIGGFSKKGDVAKSITLFNLMPEKDGWAWTAVISGLVNCEKFAEALHWYMSMARASFRPNVKTLSCLISAAAGLANSVLGSQLHAHVLKMNMALDLSVQNSLVSMYSKCGNISDAHSVFVDINSPNVISFNSMITGFAYHGLGRESLKLFEQMQTEGQEPNEITFLGVLSACAHMGLVGEGQKYFRSMMSIFHIEPGPDHYACMIDLLGRAGLLDQAIEMIRSMPFEPNAGVWGALLSASCSYLYSDIAELAASHLRILEPHNATPHVMLSNMYSTLGGTVGDKDTRKHVLKGIKKPPGCSWIST